jgi:hypothetical protein
MKTFKLMQPQLSATGFTISISVSTYFAFLKGQAKQQLLRIHRRR